MYMSGIKIRGPPARMYLGPRNQIAGRGHREIPRISTYRDMGPDQKYGTSRAPRGHTELGHPSLNREITFKQDPKGVKIGVYQCENT